MQLSIHYGQVVHTDVMTCGVSMVRYGRRGPKIFPESIPKDPCRLPYLFLIMLQSVTLIPVDYSTFWYDVVPVFGGHQEVPDGVTSLEMDLDPPLCHKCFKALA